MAWGMILWTLALLSLGLWLFYLVNALDCLRLFPRLTSIPADEARLPSVTVLVPARNEERALARCLESLLAQELDELEIIVLNDRSTDQTGRIAEKWAGRSGGRLRVIHLSALPEGWLGKCHALHRGAAEARGEILLFTDGDVIFEPGAIRQAVALMVRDRLDHLVVLPSLITHTFAEQVALTSYALNLTAGIPARLYARRGSWVYLGIGAFNMVKRRAYDAAGGHERLRLHVVDDMALGQLMKWSGFRCLAARGQGLVRVRWQDSLWGIVKGLEKNAFAATGYSLPVATLAVSALTVMNFWPWVGLFVGPGAARMICGVTALGLQPLLGVGTAITMRHHPLSGLLLPLGSLATSAAFAHSTVKTLRLGGIRWRETFHSTRELKAWLADYRREMRERRRRIRSARPRPD